jgi:hypothetical protein
VPIYHFQILAPGGAWEAVGSGLGVGVDPVAEALDELRGFYAGALPAGIYQVLESGSRTSTWTSFEIASDGELLWT